MTAIPGTSARARIPKALFGRFLRYGRLDGFDGQGDGVERKINPWHDPATGRFTFKDGGNDTWGGGGFTGGGGGSMGGGGASGSWAASPKTQSAPSGSQKVPGVGTLSASNIGGIVDAAAAPAGTTVTDNGYTYEIDDRGRTTQVTGTLTLNPDQARSRSAQAAAGGADRLPTEDGGHYIAARFDGPTNDFNHFAQDANFNRGGYRVLENQWANDVKSGKQVYVAITPTYSGLTQRPSSISVVFTVNGARSLRSFENQSRGTSRGH